MYTIYQLNPRNHVLQHTYLGTDFKGAMFQAMQILEAGYFVILASSDFSEIYVGQPGYWALSKVSASKATKLLGA